MIQINVRADENNKDLEYIFSEMDRLGLEYEGQYEVEE